MSKNLGYVCSAHARWGNGLVEITDENTGNVLVVDSDQMPLVLGASGKPLKCPLCKKDMLLPYPIKEVRGKITITR